MSSATNDNIKALAKGAVGCIVMPALQCTNNNEPDDMNRVSKIFKDKGEYEEELASSMKLSEKLKDVKRANEYFIYKATDCKLDAKQKERLNKEQIKSKCSDPAIAIADIYVLNLFEGVRKLNSKLIYHLDLSTDNVLLSHDKMKIIDFGRCFIAEDEKSFNASFIKTHFSKNGGNFGKPKYVAPELLATIPGGEYMLAFKFGNELYTECGVNKDYIMDLKTQINDGTLTLKECFEKADVWALGAILYIIKKILPDFSKVLPEVALALETLIESFTSIDLNSRPNIDEAFIQYKKFVKKFNEGRGIFTPSPTPSPTMLPADLALPTVSPVARVSSKVARVSSKDVASRLASKGGKTSRKYRKSRKHQKRLTKRKKVGRRKHTYKRR
jgi:serine/threonine protein kinase